MLKPGISILVLLICTLSRAQTDSIFFSFESLFNLKLSYNSSLIYPGISTGIEFPVHCEIVQVSQNHNITNYFKKERCISGNINWYHHPDFHDNVYITAEWVMRRTKYTGFISEFSAGPGFSRTFLGGTTYKVDENDNISKVTLAGYNYALIIVSGGIGYDFSVKKQKPFSTVVKMNLISLFPYNSTIYFRPVIELGVRYMPGRTKSISNKVSFVN
jgi:hypothetical protein